MKWKHLLFLDVFFLVEFEIKNLRTTLEENMDLTESQKDHLNQLNELNEKFVVSIHHTLVIQHQCSKWHDRFIKKNMFHEGNWALLYASWFKWYFKGKLCTIWLGSYKVDTVFDNETVRLNAIDEQQIPLFSNGRQLRLYHNPLLKDAFASHVSSNANCQLVQ